jgi:hypothetical protein
MAQPTQQQKSVAEQAREMVGARLTELQSEITSTQERLAALQSEASELDVMLNPQVQVKEQPTPPQAPEPSAAAASQNGSGPTGRAKEFLDSIRANPGQNVVFHQKALGLTQPNYLYRIRNSLRDEGLIRQEGNGLVAV